MSFNPNNDDLRVDGQTAGDDRDTTDADEPEDEQTSTAPDPEPEPDPMGGADPVPEDTLRETPPVGNVEPNPVDPAPTEPAQDFGEELGGDPAGEAAESDLGPTNNTPEQLQDDGPMGDPTADDANPFDDGSTAAMDEQIDPAPRQESRSDIGPGGVDESPGAANDVARDIGGAVSGGVGTVGDSAAGDLFAGARDAAGDFSDAATETVVDPAADLVGGGFERQAELSPIAGGGVGEGDSAAGEAFTSGVGETIVETPEAVLDTVTVAGEAAGFAGDQLEAEGVSGAQTAAEAGVDATVEAGEVAVEAAQENPARTAGAAVGSVVAGTAALSGARAAGRTAARARNRDIEAPGAQGPDADSAVLERVQSDLRDLRGDERGQLGAGRQRQRGTTSSPGAGPSDSGRSSVRGPGRPAGVADRQSSSSPGLEQDAPQSEFSGTPGDLRSQAQLNRASVGPDPTAADADLSGLTPGVAPVETDASGGPADAVTQRPQDLLREAQAGPIGETDEPAGGEPVEVVEVGEPGTVGEVEVVSEPEVGPETEPIVEPGSDLVTGPESVDVVEPGAGTITDPGTGTTTEPDTTPVTEPGTTPGTTPIETPIEAPQQTPETAPVETPVETPGTGTPTPTPPPAPERIARGGRPFGGGGRPFSSRPRPRPGLPDSDDFDVRASEPDIGVDEQRFTFDISVPDPFDDDDGEERQSGGAGGGGFDPQTGLADTGFPDGLDDDLGVDLDGVFDER